MQFPEDTVSDVTQNRFDKYFDGSELVVAGKVLPSDSNTLTSLTTASAVSKMNKSRLQENLISHESEVHQCPLSRPVLQARLDITLETDADTAELDTELAKQQHSFTGFARQMWAYITIKQLISER